MKETYDYDLSEWEEFFELRMNQIAEHRQKQLKESMALTNTVHNKVDMETLEENMLIDFENELLTSFEIKEFPSRGQNPLNQEIQETAG